MIHCLQRSSPASPPFISASQTKKLRQRVIYTKSHGEPGESKLEFRIDSDSRSHDIFFNHLFFMGCCGILHRTPTSFQDCGLKNTYKKITACVPVLRICGHYGSVQPNMCTLYYLLSFYCFKNIKIIVLP